MTDFNIADFLSISPDSIVAYCPERIVTRRMLAQDIMHARSALYSLQASRFALYEENGYVFLVWLLAAWQNGQTVVLVPEDLSTIRQALVMPWVGESGKAAGANALTNWQQATTHTIPSTMYFDAPGLALFTSGSSGSAHTINKSVPQLWQEAEMLEQVFGSHLPDTARFAGTVPHQHMFGLPFRLLWPFRAGRPFISKMFRYLEELLTLDICPHVLISSPATLKRITQMANITPKATIIRVFSAGSPLPCEIATHCAQQLNTQTVEIYGSTETGAAIYRMSPHFRWHAMPDVTLAINDETQCLKLRSPLLGNDNWYQTQDVVVQKNEDWQFLGRSDRVAKIEGQRVSLDEIESALSSLEEITEARVAPTHDEREEIVAVVVLSNMGKAIMQQNSKARFDRMLCRRLKTTLVRAAIPRRWRYVDMLPYNAMGKIPQKNITALFKARLLPPGTLCHRDHNRVEILLSMQEALSFFEGHFSALSVLPGVTQIDWAIRFAERYLPSFRKIIPKNAVSCFSSLHKLKFQRIIRPSDCLVLTLTCQLEHGQLFFEYHSKRHRYSQGCIEFSRRSL